MKKKKNKTERKKKRKKKEKEKKNVAKPTCIKEKRLALQMKEMF